MEMKRQ
jgi:hypothetical protein